LAGYLMNVSILAVSVAVVLVLTPYLPPSGHPTSEALRNNPSFDTIFSSYIGAAIMAPVWEEVMFRGLLFPAFAYVLRSPVAGALVSSILFGAIHPQGPAGMLPLVVIALMNCWLTYRTRSLIPAIVLHSVHNSFILLVALYT
jgi:uncharacterized protein